MDSQNEIRAVEQEEESKLKQKYPSIQRPGPQFLQKRLHKGQKFFDSGDYNMAKAAAAKGNKRLPESKLNSGLPLPPQATPATAAQTITSPTAIIPAVVELTTTTVGDAIPTPDCLATRKASIHVPSKLVSN